MNDGSGTGDQIVLVPVPARHLDAVYRALAHAMGDEQVIPPKPSPQRGWTEDEISKLKRELRNATVLTLLNVTAARAGEWVTLSEIEHRAGQSHAQARGDLAGFTRLIRREFATKPTGAWPVMFDWKPSPDVETRACYCMSPDVAQWWNASP
jgi:hypothetical protein